MKLTNQTFIKVQEIMTQSTPSDISIDIQFLDKEEFMEKMPKDRNPSTSARVLGYIKYVNGLYTKNFIITLCAINESKHLLLVNLLHELGHLLHVIELQKQNKTKALKRVMNSDSNDTENKANKRSIKILRQLNLERNDLIKTLLCGFSYLDIRVNSVFLEELDKLRNLTDKDIKLEYDYIDWLGDLFKQYTKF